MKTIRFDGLPNGIFEIVQGKPYINTNVGLSGAEVRVYDGCVLKIQPHTQQSANEAAIMEFLNGRALAPKLIAYETQGDVDFLLMSKLNGAMLCDKKYLSNPKLLFEKAAEAVYTLHSIPVCDCPCDMSLDKKLSFAEHKVLTNSVDMNNVNPELLGKNGRFTTPEQLFKWLIDNKPAQDFAVTHGDLCLPNIFDCNGRIGFIDFPYAGVADRYSDIALLLRSCRDNLEGGYGEYHAKFDEDLFFDVLGITPDYDKIEYYILLDELF